MKKFMRLSPVFTLTEVRGHRHFCRTIAGLTSLMTLMMMSAPAFAGQQIFGSAAELTKATGGSFVTVTDKYAQFDANSGASSAVLEWASFSIPEGKEMNFNGSGTTFFNLVDATASKSQIDGIISGNGSVWVINPNGIAFGASSRVDVGGLFAAAAGNISNVDDLEKGKATTPTFSSMSGVVWVDPGSKHKSEQTVLLGCMDVVGGDFSNVGELDVGTAAGAVSVVVDEINGGKVKINYDEFLPVVGFNDLMLNDLIVGGDLEATSVQGNAIVMDVESLSGNIHACAQTGNVLVPEGATVKANGVSRKVTLESSSRGYLFAEDDVRYFSDGDVYVNGKIEANGTEGKINLLGGTGALAKGGVNVGSTAMLEAKKGVVTISSNNEDVNMQGHIDGGKVELVAGKGWRTGETTWCRSAGDVNIKEGSQVESCLGIAQLTTYDGDINIEKNATVEAKNDGGVVSLSAGCAQSGYGSITVAGTLSASGNGVLDEQGKVTTPAAVSIVASDGVGSKGDVMITSDGKVSVCGDNARIQIVSAKGEGAQGNIVIDGVVEATGCKSEIVSWSGYGKMSVGSTEVSRTVVASGDDSFVELHAAYGEGACGNMRVDGEVSTIGARGVTRLVASQGEGSAGSVTVQGSVNARGVDGEVEIGASVGEGSIGSVFISGQVDAWRGVIVSATQGDYARGNININGVVCSGGQYVGLDESGTLAFLTYNSPLAGTIVAAGVGRGSESVVNLSGIMASCGQYGNCSISGAIGADSRVDINIAENGRLGGYYDSHLLTMNGNVVMDGKITGSKSAIWALNRGGGNGNVTFGANGTIIAGNSVEIIADGNLLQPSAEIPSVGGWTGSIAMPFAAKADRVSLIVGENIGAGDSYFSVDGNVRAVVGGNAAIAAADGKDYAGNKEIISSSRKQIESVELAFGTKDILLDGSMAGDDQQIHALLPDMGASLGNDAEAAVSAGGNLRIYTAGELNANGMLKAGGNLTVSAATFGDMSYLQADGLLSINNVGKPAYPQIAYFESIYGVEPMINNQPNDTVIFVDGRLAGGNLKILNQFGANEAFLVQTPELKSTQGIFGNPTFLHSDLDVANPMEVSAIDYMLQETPRLTLDKDFPKEADQHVDSVVIPEKDSIQFGREAKGETVADDKIAMAK